MHLDVISQNKIVLNEDIEEVVLPTPKGQIGILPHHVNLVTKVEPGEMIIRIKGKTEYFAITGGFLEVNNNKVTILADYAIQSEEIEIEKALEAKKHAEETLRKNKESISERDFAIAKADLIRAMMELRVANKRRRGQTLP